jgi:hypothetical protein
LLRFSSSFVKFNSMSNIWKIQRLDNDQTEDISFIIYEY